MTKLYAFRYYIHTKKQELNVRPIRREFMNLNRKMIEKAFDTMVKRARRCIAVGRGGGGGSIL